MGMTLFGRLINPGQRLLVVLCNPLAVAIHHAEVELCLGMTLLSGLLHLGKGHIFPICHLRLCPPNPVHKPRQHPFFHFGLTT
ncbi:hypothetical protein D3C73_594640 [compost metagenome]